MTAIPKPPVYIVLDFESLYDKDYSLSMMTPPEYILHRRWECIGCAVAEGDDGEPRFYDEDGFRNYALLMRAWQHSGHKLIVVSHNALFDMCVLAWRFGVVPDLCIDTMSMARAMTKAFHPRGRISLAEVAKQLGLGVKGDTIGKVLGMGRRDIERAGLWDDYCRYAVNDAVLCRGIFQHLRKEFPKGEYEINDMVIKMAVVPRFQLDRDLLQDHYDTVRAEKAQLIAECGMSDTENLMSNEKLAQVLRDLGVEPPTKISPRTGKVAYAFSKSDHEFAELLEHEDPAVQAVVAARIGVKSTLEESRAERFLALADVTWPGNFGKGWFPVPIAYSGAHTHRFSGEWKVNPQNLSRPDKRYPGRGKLRRSLRAPEGKIVMTSDSSQIEARLVGEIAGEDKLMSLFRAGVDVYSTFGSTYIYHRTITKADVAERFCSKQAVLGLGFGMGAPKYQSQIRKDSRNQLGFEITLTDVEAKRIVQAYRGGYSKIPLAWNRLDELMYYLAREDSRIEFGPVTLEYQAIRLPNGHRLFYHNLRQIESERGKQWICDYGRETKFLFGGKVYENIVQACARIINTETARRMKRLFPKYMLAHQVHDELIYVIDKQAENEFRDALTTEMTRQVPWLPGLPLGCETHHGPTYGDAK